MWYRTRNIDRVASEGVRFTDYYGEQSCTAGRAAFITGQNPYRTGLTKVGLPGAPLGLQPQDPTIAKALKAQGYATGQFGKNHLGDRDEHLPTMHGFDEFFGNLYHLNAEEEPELPDFLNTRRSHPPATGHQIFSSETQAAPICGGSRAFWVCSCKEKARPHNGTGLFRERT